MSAASIVTLEYVAEVIRRGKLAREDPDSLQRLFKLPNAIDYFPDEVTTDLMSKEKSREVLVRNEVRKTLFVGTTLLIVHGEQGHSKSLESLASICKAAGARIVTEDVSMLSDEESLLRCFRRNKSEAETYLAESGEAASQAPDEGLVVVCEDKDVGASWHKSVMLMTRRLNIAMTSTGATALTRAILFVDPRQYLNQVAEPTPTHFEGDEDDSETLPPTLRPDQRDEDSRPSTAMMEDEQNEAAASDSTMLLERATTPQPSTLPSTAMIMSTIQASPRKPRRRADMALRDPFEDLFGASAAASASFPTSTADEPTDVIPSTAEQEEVRPAHRYRRNGGPESKRPRISETWRNIFDSKDETKEDGGIVMEGLTEGPSQSMTRKYREELDEADRLASQQTTAPRKEVKKSVEATRKRKAHSPPIGSRESSQIQRRIISDEEVEDEGEGVDVRLQSYAGRSATIESKTGETIREKEPSPPSTAKTATPTADTDTKFLQAMATSKKSKKTLDPFDKEFNSLRIAKPSRTTGHHGKIIADVDDPEYRAWEQMGPSDFDINAAGNFVQVDFVPLIYHRSEAELRERAIRQQNQQSEWAGKPNFKKFRSKENSKQHQRHTIAMDVDEGLDYGVGDGYARPRPRPTSRVMVPVEDDEGGEVELMGPPPKADPTSKKIGRNRSPLADPFSEAEDEEGAALSSRSAIAKPSQARRGRYGLQLREEREEGEDDEDVRAKGTNGSKRRAVDVRLDVDVDLDDSVYRTRRSRTPASIQSSTVVGSKRDALDLSSDDDDDDSSTFSGFRKKRRS
ncbi:hypothetical protein CBS101457_006187 [Exobasidium rhododendri]|nr:hypothetical protein CBS101457_006187 [Exobasidium rhododendri]